MLSPLHMSAHLRVLLVLLASRTWGLGSPVQWLGLGLVRTGAGGAHRSGDAKAPRAGPEVAALGLKSGVTACRSGSRGQSPEIGMERAMRGSRAGAGTRRAAAEDKAWRVQEQFGGQLHAVATGSSPPIFALFCLPLFSLAGTQPFFMKH